MSRELPSRAGRVARLVLAISVVVGAGLVAHHALIDDAEASGPYSSWTRSELGSITARGAARNPVLLPEQLPPGVDAEDDSGFYLVSNPITARDRRNAGKVWHALYVVSALPPAVGSVTGYSVYQEWLGAPGLHRPRCNKHDRPVGVLTRRVGDDRLTICLGPHPTEAARRYWRNVRFTADLDEVDWLRDGERD
jgi:hypothetical protein